MPESIRAAVIRADQAAKLGTDKAKGAAAVEIESAAVSGKNLVADAIDHTRADGIAVSSQALSSVISANWFTQQYCNGFSGVQGSYCYLATGAGTWTKANTYRSAAVICGDTGSATLKMWRDGSLLVNDTASYGNCRRWRWSGGQDWLGFLNRATIERRVDWAQQTARFASYFVWDDRFYSAPPGWV